MLTFRDYVEAFVFAVSVTFACAVASAAIIGGTIAGALWLVELL